MSFHLNRTNYPTVIIERTCWSLANILSSIQIIEVQFYGKNFYLELFEVSAGLSTPYNIYFHPNLQIIVK